MRFGISGSLSVSACIDALEDAVSKYGKPEIINSEVNYLKNLLFRWYKKSAIFRGFYSNIGAHYVL
jgi:hypothetical protein